MSWLSSIFNPPQQSAPAAPAAPAAPQYGESMRNVLQAQIDLAPQLYQKEAEYQPKYQDLQNQIQAQQAKSQLATYQQLQPGMSGLENAYTKQTQANQLQGLQQRAPGYIQAFQQAQGTYGINKALQDYAEGNLAKQMQNDFKLTPEQQRSVDQASLSRFAGRGTALGQQANLSNILNRYQFQQQRQAQGLQQMSGIASHLGGQSGAALTSFYQQPMYAQNFAGNTAQTSLMAQQQAGPQYFNPESQTGMGSIYGAYNAQMGYAGAGQQAAAAQNAGRSSMFGSIIGGGLGAIGSIFCWVAREVYGEENPAWLLFRDWMLNDAPKWLLAMYIAFGEQFAKFISNKPRLKAIIRKWMDSKIAV